MVKIAICDDEQNICEALHEMVENYGKKNNTPFDISVYYNGNSLMRYLEEGGQYDIIFLDIELVGSNGIEVGKYIRNQIRDEVTKIIYISWKDLYAMDLFEVRPMNFIIKPIKEEVVWKNLSKSIELLDNEPKYFFYKVGNTTHKLLIKDILYFESYNRGINIHTFNGLINYTLRFEELAEEIDQFYFWRIHKSYIVNYMNVEEFDYRNLVMDNGDSLTISQPYRSKIRSMQKRKMGTRE